VEQPRHALEPGTEVIVAGEPRLVERRGGTAERPLVRLSGVAEREAATALRGEPLLVSDEGAEGEGWLAEDLVGLRIEGVGPVRRVLDGPSCSVLETEDGTLVPLIRDAIVAVDQQTGVIRADLAFLGLEDEG
jgi:16S rRNA processing protein RimM